MFGFSFSDIIMGVVLHIFRRGQQALAVNTKSQFFDFRFYFKLESLRAHYCRSNISGSQISVINKILQKLNLAILAEGHNSPAD